MLYSKKISSEQGFAHLLVIVGFLGIVVFVGSITAANVTTTKEFSQSDAQVKGVLLAKGGDDGGSDNRDSLGSSNSGSKESSNSNADSGSGSSDSGGSSEKPSSSTSGSNINPATTTTKTEFKPTPTDNTSTAPSIKAKTEESIGKQKTEIKFSETEKIKTRIENNRTRIDVYQEGIKVRYEMQDGRVTIKAEDEAGEELGLPEQEIFKIDERLSQTGIKVATDGGKLVVTRNNIGAVSNFPLQIDLNTNQLIASTPAGIKILTTLPDQAVQNMLAANVISKLNPQDLVKQAQSGDITSVKDIVLLGERNGVPVYEINGLKEHKLLGFIPVTTQTTVFVSAETGQPVAQTQSILANIINALSR